MNPIQFQFVLFHFCFILFDKYYCFHYSWLLSNSTSNFQL